MRCYRPAAMPHTVTTERKTMPNTRSPTGWYYCSGDGAEIAFTSRPPRKLKNLQKWVLPRERFAES